jgi:hypothetical protein
MVTVDFVCPACDHAAGRIAFDDNVCGVCPACQIEVEHGGGKSLLLIPRGGFEPPARMLARRVDKPKRSKVRHALEGDELRIWRTFGLLTPWAKRYTLSPAGLQSTTRRGAGSPVCTLASMRGFMPMQLIAGFIGEPREATVMPCSALVIREGDLVLYQPLFSHSREDAVYFCSLLNEHLDRVQHAGAPYRGHA